MTMLRSLAAMGLFAGFAASGANAATLADWTFETTAPTTAGPYTPEIGAGSATANHVTAATYSSPSGNGSSHSYSSNNWSVGDYYQFSISTLGDSGVSLSFDQTSSGTGPRDFQLSYSIDGATFTSVGNYSVLANAAPNAPWTASTYNSAYTFSDDLTSISQLNNQAAVYFRMVDLDTTAAAGGTVGTSGTDRVDNVVVSANVSAVPLPATIWLFGGGLAGLVAMRRRHPSAVKFSEA